MSIRSAHEKKEELDDNGLHYCFPLALDALLPPNKQLPRKYFDMFGEAEAAVSGAPHTMRQLMCILFRDYFEVEPVLDDSEQSPGLYHAFSTTAQSYCPIESPVYTAEDLALWKKCGVGEKQLRLKDILLTATRNNCLILPYLRPPHDEYEHVGGLQVVDPGSEQQAEYYAIWEYGSPASKQLYDMNDLMGLGKKRDRVCDDYAPLPEFDDEDFPNGEKSWALLILPPAPN